MRISPRSTAPAHRSPRRSRSGFTLIELLVALTVLLGALSALTHALLGNLELNEQSRQTSIASQAVRTLIETMRGLDPATAFVDYNESDADDPPGGAPGSNFAVGGLEPDPGDVDGMVGQVLFPVTAGTPEIVTELAASGFPGMPRDLNLDGDVVDGNVNGDMVLLPVIVRLQWRGPGGVRQIYEVRTILAGS